MSLGGPTMNGQPLRLAPAEPSSKAELAVRGLVEFSNACEAWLRRRGQGSETWKTARQKEFARRHGPKRRISHRQTRTDTEGGAA